MTRDRKAPTGESRVALVIGNAAYRNARKLDNPVNDARAMARALRECSFDVLGPNGEGYTNLDQRGMRAAIKEFGQKLQANPGVGLFYFAGHGVEANDTNYLIPVEAAPNDETDLKYEGFDIKDVLDQFVGNRLNIVILDACRDNPFARSFKRTRGGGEGLKQVEAPTGTLIAYATAPHQTASDGTGVNGLYTEQLLEAIRVKGLTIEQVFKRVRVKVQERSKGTQIPWENSSLNGDFYFIPESRDSAATGVNTNPGPVKPVDSGAVEREAWETVKNSADLEDFREFLRNFPNGIYSGTARVKLRKLEAAAVKPTPPKPTGTGKSPRQPVSKPTAPSPGTQIEGVAGIKWVYIPAGEFRMGWENGEPDEKPVHRVLIKEPFWMGKYEVTQEQWESLMGTNPSSFTGCPQCPVENVSWDDCQEFIQRLNAQSDGVTYHLPTEAEWEYACRAGTTGDYARNLDAMGWYDGNSGGKTHPVGQKQPNAWGLHDMHGNVWEWCSDWYGAYPSGWVTNPTGPTTGSRRVLRGGSWRFSEAACHSAYRGINPPGSRSNYLGFRLVRIQK